MPMSDVVSLLSRYMQALVVDQTGLAGEFEVKLVWTPDDRPVPEDQQGASVSPPLRSNWALSWNRGRGRWMCMVVDRAEKTPLKTEYE